MTKLTLVIAASLLLDQAAGAEDFHLSPDLVSRAQMSTWDFTPKGVGVLACSGLQWIQLHLDFDVLLPMKPIDSPRQPVWIDEMNAGWMMRIDWTAPVTEASDYRSDWKLRFNIGYQFELSATCEPDSQVNLPSNLCLTIPGVPWVIALTLLATWIPTEPLARAVDVR